MHLSFGHAQPQQMQNNQKTTHDTSLIIIFGWFAFDWLRSPRHVRVWINTNFICDYCATENNYQLHNCTLKYVIKLPVSESSETRVTMFIYNKIIRIHIIMKQ